jgi:HlyD family secretion protein
MAPLASSIKPKKLKKLPLAIAVVLLILLGIVALTVRSWAERRETPVLSESSPLLVEVQRGPIVVEIEQKGSLEAVESTRIMPEIKGPAKIVNLVKEGAWVEKDQVLVQLDGTEVEKLISELSIDYQTAEGNVMIATENLRLQELTNESSIIQAQYNADFAKKDLAKYVNGDASLQRQQLELAVETAKIGVEQAKDKYDRMPDLEERGFATAFEVREAEIQLMEAESALEAAENSLDVWIRLTHPKTLAELEADVESTARFLTRTIEQNQNMLATKKNQLETAEKNRETLGTRISELETQLKGMTIKAPGPGIVVYGDDRSSGRRNRGGEEEELKVGGNAYPGKAVMQLPNLKEMMMVASIDERFINQIEEGQPAEIFVNALPGYRFTGKVSKIGSIASGGGGPGEVKEYDVEIPLDEHPKTPLLPGMNARAIIRIAEREEALFIPKEAVHSKNPDKRKIVYVFNRGELEPVEVETGIQSEHFVEILDGIQDGTMVYLGKPPETQSADGKPSETGGEPSASPAANL